MKKEAKVILKIEPGERMVSESLYSGGFMMVVVNGYLVVSGNVVAPGEEPSK